MLVSETPAGPARVKRRSWGSLYSADRPFSEKVMGDGFADGDRDDRLGPAGGRGPK